MSDLSRIEDNIRLMISKGAPVADIDEYLRIEGHTPATFKAAMTEPSTAEKVAGTVNTGVNWLGTQLTKGATSLVGAPDAVGKLAERGGEWAGEKVGAPIMGKNIGTAFRSMITFGGLTPDGEKLNDYIFKEKGVPEVNAGDNPALTLTNPYGIDAKVNLGKMLDVGAQAIPGTLALGGGVLPAVLGGATSEAAGQATAGEWYEPLARIAGSIPGAMAGTRMQTPLPASLTPEQQRLVTLAQQDPRIANTLTVGQLTGRGRGVESALSRYPTSEGVFARQRDAQNQGLNAQAWQQAGVKSDRMDTAAMSAGRKQVSAEFEAAKNASGDVPLKPDFYNETRRAVARYEANTAEGDQIAIVRQQLDNFMDPKLIRANSPYPTLSPEQYQQFRSDLVEAINTQERSGPRKVLQQVRASLDDAMEAALPKDQADAWRDARKHWAAYKTIAKSAATGTVDSRGSGNFSPASMQAALRNRQGADRFAEAQGGLNDTARLAGYLSDTRPNSNTPNTTATQNLITGGAFTTPLAAAGYAAAGPVGGAVGAAAGQIAPNIAARAMTGQGWITPAGPLPPIPASWVRNYLANQSLPNFKQSVATVPAALAPDLLQREKRRPGGLLN